MVHLYTLLVQVEPRWCLNIKRKLQEVKATVCSTLSSTVATASTVDDVWLHVLCSSVTHRLCMRAPVSTCSCLPVSVLPGSPQPSVLLWGSRGCCSWREEATRIGRCVFFLLSLVKGGGVSG